MVQNAAPGKRYLKIAATLASGVFVAGSVMAFQAPAASATSCGNGNACYYYGTGYGGPSFGDQCGINNFGNFNFNGSTFQLNNNVASAKGSTRATVQLFDGVNRTGASVGLIGLGQNVSSFGANNNKATSSQFLYPQGGGCPTPASGSAATPSE